jgi:predicted ATPase
MRILSFEYQDADGWTLEPMKLDGFNLLVGLSGAGKTRILRAIEKVHAIALGNVDAFSGARFAIDFEHAGFVYRWAAELEPLAPDDELPLIRAERITQAAQSLVERTRERFVFRGQSIPKLDRAKSAISLLKEDSAMAPLHAAFSRCLFRELNNMRRWDLRSSAQFDKQRMQYASVGALGADFSLSIHRKAELFSELFRGAFAEIETGFREAFPTVKTIEIQRIEAPGATSKEMVNIACRETGVDDLVRFSSMSSGMQRYLSFLIHLTFAPPGTVVLIDELETSFGINCLPDATRFLLRRAPDLQLILTSHHPYIIEHIPTACWKIVTRKGSDVRVLDASAIPALEESRSHLDRFTRLINLPEYTEGIQAA